MAQGIRPTTTALIRLACEKDADAVVEAVATHRLTVGDLCRAVDQAQATLTVLRDARDEVALAELATRGMG